MTRIPSEWLETSEPGEPIFTMHNIQAYKEMAQEPHFDYFLRLWFFAVANMEANGHATFKQGRVAQALGKCVDGVWVPAPP